VGNSDGRHWAEPLTAYGQKPLALDTAGLKSVSPEQITVRIWHLRLFAASVKVTSLQARTVRAPVHRKID